MQQVFGTDNHYIQDDGCGYEIIFLGLRNKKVKIAQVVIARHITCCIIITSRNMGSLHL